MCGVLVPTFFAYQACMAKNPTTVNFWQLFRISNTGWKFHSSTVLRSLTAWSVAYAARHRDLIRHTQRIHTPWLLIWRLLSARPQKKARRQASRKTRRALSRCSRIDRRPSAAAAPLLYWVSLVLAVRYLRRRQRRPRSGRRFRGRHRS